MVVRLNMSHDALPSPHSPKLKQRWVAISGLIVLTLALWALHREFSAQGYAQLQSALHALPIRDLALSLLLAFGSYACLIAFDIVGIRRSGHRVGLARLLPTALLAHALSHTTGFGPITGGAVRARGYAPAGMGLGDIAGVVALVSGGFALGVWGLLAAALLLEPDAAARLLGLNPEHLRWLGVALAVLWMLMPILAGRAGRSFSLRGHTWALPSGRTVAAIAALSVLELGFASASLYVLLAPAHVGFFGFLGLYTIALVGGTVSTVPGGVGVFEWALIRLLPDTASATVFAAALAYRLTYYLLPLAIAGLWVGALSLRAPTARAGRATRQSWLVLRPWLPSLLALFAFACGILLVADGTLPLPRRAPATGSLAVVESSHLLASLGGVALLLIGQGLQKRSRAAWGLALAVCLIAPPFAWLRGSGPLLSLLLLALAAALWAARHEFYRIGALLDDAWSWPWLRNLGLAMIALVWLLLFAHRHVEYRSELWWQFALSADAPRALRAMLLVCLVTLAFGLARLLHSARRNLPTPDIAELDALGPLLAQATDTKADLALLGDKALRFDPAHKSFAMVQRYGGSLIALGDPVGPSESRKKLIWQLREEADRLGLRPVFYQIGTAHWQDYLDVGLTLVKIGEEAIVPLTDFSLEGSARAELRQALKRGERSGLRFRIAAPGEIATLIPTLRAISDDWLASKSSAEKSFSVGYFEPSYLQRFPMALIETDAGVVAFANLLRAPAGGELSIDLMRYASDAPKGTMDFLFVSLMRWAREQGYTRFNLGMAPLTGLSTGRLAGRWNRFANLIAKHGEHFYGFVGLRRFKQKFAPDWQPRYLAAPGGSQLLAALLDITRLIAAGPPEAALQTTAEPSTAESREHRFE
jgi:phosphatidylglycerol lysyltransferase